MTSKTTDGITVEYTYDGLGRVTQQVSKNGDTTVKTETYTFNPGSAQVHTYRTQAGSYDVTYTYTYDDNGNILTVNDGITITSYVYDSANQLIEAYDTDLEYAWFWTYDNAGNIQSAVLRDYTQCVVDAVLSSHSYTYGDDEWGDLLTAFDSTAITYDGIGNPTTYNGYTLTWEHGRQLATMSQGNQTWEFTYDANGMRTGRKMEYGNQSYSYVYNGSQLVEMDANGIALKFTYDTDGTPLTLQAGNALYYYVTNLQGDVTGILDANGNLVARYIYDAWGRILYMSGSGVVGYNPLTYRGYVYDHGTGLYYLQSRYYDPISGRFLNADSLTSTGQGLTGNNMFAYCGNNPTSRQDSEGAWWKALTKAVKSATSKVLGVAGSALAGAVCGAVAELVSQTANYIKTGEPINWGGVAIKAASGAVYGVTYAITGSDTLASAAEAATDSVITGIVNEESYDRIMINTVNNTVDSFAQSAVFGKGKELLEKIPDKVPCKKKMQEIYGWMTGDFYKAKYAKPNYWIDSFAPNYYKAHSTIGINVVNIVLQGNR